MGQGGLGAQYFLIRQECFGGKAYTLNQKEDKISTSEWDSMDLKEREGGGGGGNLIIVHTELHGAMKKTIFYIYVAIKQSITIFVKTRRSLMSPYVPLLLLVCLWRGSPSRCS